MSDEPMTRERREAAAVMAGAGASGEHEYRAQVLDVLRVEDGRIVEITAFELHLFPTFDLPMTLS
ncbi:hypothetical protein ABI214_11440 [Prescottella soli]|uniref:Uncharacterized protein n=1 Tax=Prescottella soli TaxID=1543852 RepID=A0ABW9FZP4_9NOCA